MVKIKTMKYADSIIEVIDKNVCYYSGSLQASFLYDLIDKCGTDVEIHANTQTIISHYLNNIRIDERYNNLKLLCNEVNEYPILSELYKGAYDIKNKTFWFNRNTPIKIVVDDEIFNGYTLIIKNNKVIGYFVGEIYI